MKKRTIKDVEYVADAVIIGFLHAAAINYEQAHKEFKRHHFDMKDSELASYFEIVRKLSDTTFKNFCDFSNQRIQNAREELTRSEMSNNDKKRKIVK